MGIFRLCIKEDSLKAKMQAYAQKARTGSSKNKKSKWALKMENYIKEQQANAQKQRGLPNTKQRHNTSYTASKKR